MSSTRPSSIWSGPAPEPAVREAVYNTNDEPPPEYTGTVSIDHEGTQTLAQINDDGRVNIDVNEKSDRLTRLFAPALQQQLNAAREPDQPRPRRREKASVPLNIVIHVVGSRGDVQPFVALGKALKARHNHRVRLATHSVFQKFVESNGLEFFNIGGDPARLMLFMVNNPSLLPSMESIKAGEIGQRQKEMAEIVEGCWRSCIEPGTGMVQNPSDLYGSNDPLEEPFIADAIIANPPSFAHIHCAEKLGVPLHIIFTMPWSPTSSFPHPLANIRSSNTTPGTSNFISYSLIEMLTWQGLGGVVNRFRTKILGLEPLSTLSATGLLSRLQIPQTYCWSPALIPKPMDWGSHISVSGFFFLGGASSYTPEPGLVAFLEAGPPPIYIGFGSIVVQDPKAMTRTIFEAVAITGHRALVSKGWGGLGEAEDMPDNIYLLGDCPHDWLFQRVSCVVHHGGAGTTAAGISLGRPTVVIPFFGDQPFWGAMVARAGAGPEPIPPKALTAKNLADAILYCLTPEVIEQADKMGQAIREEDGCQEAVDSIHDYLPIDEMRCSLIPSAKAVWKVKKSSIRLSAAAANVLAQEGLIDFSNVRPIRIRNYHTSEGPFDPISGGLWPLFASTGRIGVAIADMPREVWKSVMAPGNGAQDAQRSTSTPSQQSFQKPTESSDKLSLDSFSSDSRTTTSAEFVRAKTEKKAKKSSKSAFIHGFYKEMTGKETIAARKSRITEHPSGQDGEMPRDTMVSDAAKGAGKSFGKIIDLSLKVPLDFSMGIAKGFKNAPRLYGDNNVRQPDHITGFHSGVRSATKEFGNGLYDGITGIVTQPARGAKEGGVTGFIKGVGKGLGGAILKPGAGLWGIPAYTFKGVYEEVQKHYNSNLHSYIITTRCLEGHLAASELGQEDRQKIIEGWEKCEKNEPDLLDRWRAAQQRRNGRPKDPLASFSNLAKSASTSGAPSSNSNPVSSANGNSPQQVVQATTPPTSISSESLHASPRVGEVPAYSPHSASSKSVSSDAAEIARVTSPTTSISPESVHTALNTRGEEDMSPHGGYFSLNDTLRNVQAENSDISHASPAPPPSYPTGIHDSRQFSDLKSPRVGYSLPDGTLSNVEEESMDLYNATPVPPPVSPPAYPIDGPQSDNRPFNGQKTTHHPDEDEDEIIRKAISMSLEAENKRAAELEAARREEEIVMEYVKKASLAEAQLKANAVTSKSTGRTDDSADEWD